MLDDTLLLHSKIVDSVRGARDAVLSADAQREAERKKADEMAEKKRKKEAEKANRKAEADAAKARKAMLKQSSSVDGSQGSVLTAVFEDTCPVQEVAVFKGPAFMFCVCFLSFCFLLKSRPGVCRGAEGRERRLRASVYRPGFR